MIGTHAHTTSYIVLEVTKYYRADVEGVCGGD